MIWALRNYFPHWAWFTYSLWKCYLTKIQVVIKKGQAFMVPLDVFSSLKGIWCSFQHVNSPTHQKQLPWKAEHYITGKCLGERHLNGSVGNAKKMLRVWHLSRACLPSALSALYAREVMWPQMSAFKKCVNLQPIFIFICWENPRRPVKRIGLQFQRMECACPGSVMKKMDSTGERENERKKKKQVELRGSAIKGENPGGKCC